MSAIFGIVAAPGEQVETRQARRMAAASETPGQDDSRLWSGRGATLGHALMQQTPDSLHESLPWTDPDTGVTITADAWLDNRAELQTRLGLSAESESWPDSRLILAGFATWGGALPRHLLGDFAFAIWDPHNRRLFCARDHLGSRPLYYSAGRDFVFASGIDGVLAGRVEAPAFDDEVILDVLRFGSPYGVERTFFRDVRRLPPGHALTLDHGRARLDRYWSPESVAGVSLANPDEYARRLAELLAEAVACRLRTPFDVGAHLSGGLDSSAVAVVAARQLRAAGRRLRTFAWAPPPDLHDGLDDDERRLIKVISTAEGLECQFTAMTADPARDLLNRDVTRQPVETLQREQVVQSAAAAAGVRTLLTGWGGDECVSFNGRGYIADLARRGRWWRLLREIHAKAALDTRTPVARIRSMIGQLRDRAIEPWLPDGWLDRLDPDAIEQPCELFVQEEFLRGPRQDPPVARERFRERESVRTNQLMLLRAGHLQRRMEHWQANGAAVGVGYRHPLLDLRVVEFGLGIPADLFFVNGWKRHLFRQALAGILPDEVRWNPSKKEPALLEATRALQRDLRATRDRRRRLPALHPYVNVERLSEPERWIHPERVANLDRGTRLQSLTTATAIATSCPPGGATLAPADEAPS